MGWFFFFGSWLLFGWFAYIAPPIDLPARVEPLKEKFVIHTIDNQWCDGQVTNRIMRRIESVKID